MKTEDTMKKELQLVTLYQAKKLKELGFDWIVRRYYEKNILGNFTIVSTDSKNYNSSFDECFSAPTVALAIKWFRNVKNTDGEVRRHAIGWFSGVNGSYEGEFWKTYEEAESDLLDKLIECCNS
ncbi:hypothetical protein FACS1894195_0470 [Bacteroidia bacterium]|nr:hypothetical protein FACS1894195_0470 [Bacteroidia bacterium]